MIRAPIFNDTNSTGGNLFPDSVVQENDAIGNIFLKAMTGIRAMPKLAGHDGGNLFRLEPSEKSFYLQAENACVCDAREERLDRIQNNTFGTNGVNGML